MRTRKFLTVLAAFVMATASAVLVVPAPANASVSVTTYISVLNPPGQSGKKVLDIANWSTVDRGPAHLWALRTTGTVSNQRWTIVKYMTLYTTGTPVDVYYFQNQLSGKCLDKSQDVLDANGAAVYQITCSYHDNQLWEFFPGFGGNSNWGELANLSDGRCLDVHGASFTDGAPLQVWDCTGGWNQRWNIF